MSDSKVSKTALTVAVDDGYANTKVAYFNTNESLQTSFIPSIYGNADLGHFESDMQGNALNTYRTADHAEDTDLSARFCISPNLSHPTDTRAGSYPVSAANRCVVHHAIHAAGISSEACDSIHLAVTLPIRDYFSTDREALIEKRKASLSMPVFREQGLSDTVKMLDITSVHVLPEAIMAYFDHLLDDQGEIIADEDAVVAVVDVGGHTTDIAVVQPGGNISRDRSESITLGILKYIERVQDLVLEAHKIRITNKHVNTAIQNNGIVNIRGQREDLSVFLSKASEMIVRELRAQVAQVLGDDTDVDCILYVGGGATVLGRTLSRHPNVIIPPEPHFANARGALKYMTYIRG
jgi:plasmid segregation protein ParM